MSAQGAAVIMWTPVGGTTINVGVAQDNATAFIETKALSIGDEGFSWFIDRIIVNISDRRDQTALVLEIYGSDDENGEVEFAEDNPPPESNFTLLDTIALSREDPGYTDPPGRRYYKLRFVDRSVVERWRLHGFSVYGEQGGEEF